MFLPNTAPSRPILFKGFFTIINKDQMNLDLRSREKMIFCHKRPYKTTLSQTRAKGHAKSIGDTHGNGREKKRGRCAGRKMCREDFVPGGICSGRKMCIRIACREDKFPLRQCSGRKMFWKKEFKQGKFPLGKLLLGIIPGRKYSGRF